MNIGKPLASLLFSLTKTGLRPPQTSVGFLRPYAQGQTSDVLPQSDTLSAEPIRRTQDKGLTGPTINALPPVFRHEDRMILAIPSRMRQLLP